MNPVQDTVLKQHIHTVLLEVFGQRVNRDEDGDWPIGVNTRPVFVRPVTAPAPHAFVFTRAATGIDKHCAAELLDLNAAAAWAKVIRSPTGDIFVIQRIQAESITASTLRQALESVATCANDIGPLLGAVYGGPPESGRDDH